MTTKNPIETGKPEWLSHMEIVRQSSSLPADLMKQAVLKEVASWRQGPPTDDVSLMLVHVH